MNIYEKAILDGFKEGLTKEAVGLDDVSKFVDHLLQGWKGSASYKAGKSAVDAAGGADLAAAYKGYGDKADDVMWDLKRKSIDSDKIDELVKNVEKAQSRADESLLRDGRFTTTKRRRQRAAAALKGRLKRMSDYIDEEGKAPMATSIGRHADKGLAAALGLVALTSD